VKKAKTGKKRKVDTHTLLVRIVAGGIAVLLLLGVFAAAIL